MFNLYVIILTLQVEDGYRTFCDETACTSVLRLPTFSLSGELRLVCSAHVGRIYAREAEGVTRLVPPPQPIQGVPLTSAALVMPRVGFDSFIVVFSLIYFELV
jgi:hypothetical protein